MRLAIALALFAVAFPCVAQKWVDEKGKVYYGAPPPGIKVKPAPMTGGATSNVGSQGGGSSARVAPEGKNLIPDPKLPFDPNDPRFKAAQPQWPTQKSSQGGQQGPQYRDPGAQTPLKSREMGSGGAQ